MSSPVTRFFASHQFARALGSVGRLMITTGTVILLLVAYQLWGTNLQANKSQNQLQQQFAETATLPDDGTVAETTTLPAVTKPGATTTLPATQPAKVAPTLAPPADGAVVGNITIPTIGLHNFYFVQGTTVDQLKRGAGHYVTTPLPGQAGNAAIAGHRTTYAAPLHNIDKVKVGDPIIVKTIQGTFRYLVTGQRVVSPHDTSVLLPTPTPTLTLTACHPKFSAKQRIITFAKLVGNPVPKLANQDAAANAILERNRKAGANADGTSTIDQFETEPALRFPGAWWGVGCMLLWIAVRLLAWQGHRTKRFPRWVPYLLGTPVCLLLLYFFFEAFSYEGFTRALNLAI